MPFSGSPVEHFFGQGDGANWHSNSCFVSVEYTPRKQKKTVAHRHAGNCREAVEFARICQSGTIRQPPRGWQECGGREAANCASTASKTYRAVLLETNLVGTWLSFGNGKPGVLGRSFASIRKATPGGHTSGCAYAPGVGEAGRHL